MDWRRLTARKPTARMAAAAGAAIAVLVLLALVARQSPQRRRAPLPASSPALGVAAAAAPELVDRPLEEWTPRFRELIQARRFDALAGELDQIRDRRADVYDSARLGYLHARAKIETGELAAARDLLEPFLAPGHPLRDLALYYRTEIAQEGREPEEASRLRQELIFAHPRATYRSAAISEEAAYLAEHGDAARLGVFLVRLAPTVEAATRRQVEARLVERLVREDQDDAALERALRLLRENATDDAADRVFRAIDAQRFLDRLGPADWVLLGESARSHRHFDRAIPLLERALAALPSQREELLFSIGRSRFGQEDYEKAEKTYLAGADRLGRRGEPHQLPVSRRPRGPAPRRRRRRRAPPHARDRRGPFAPARPRRPARRRRAARRRRRSLPRPRAPRSRTRSGCACGWARSATATPRRTSARSSGSSRAREAVRDATLAYAVALIEAGRHEAGVRELQRLPKRLAPFDAAEADYWKARGLERTDVPQALAAYLRVLRAEVPTHFAYFARKRLAEPALAARAQVERQALAEKAEARRQAGDLAGAQPRADRRGPAHAAGRAGGRAGAAGRPLPRGCRPTARSWSCSPEPFPQLPLRGERGAPGAAAGHGPLRRRDRRRDRPLPAGAARLRPDPLRGPEPGGGPARVDPGHRAAP